jgi:SNF2 family DNA or RNA helicase
VPPWQHQLEAIIKCQDRKRYALFFEQGTGKTATAINIMRSIFVKRQKMMRTLIFTPRIVVPNWKREFATHSKIDPKNIWALSGSGKKRVSTFNDVCFSEKTGKAQPQIIITNYESLLMKDLYAAFIKWEPQILILDESHKCKNMSSRRTKNMIRLSQFQEYCYLLSGTPITNDLMDVFAQYRIMDQGKTFGQNWVAFRRQFFYDVNAGMPKHKYFPNWKVRKDMLGRMNDRLAKTSMRVKKEECMDLPPLVKQRVEVELSAAQKRHYNAMKKDFITMLDEGACVAQLAITKALRLQQILSGFIKVEKEDGEMELIPYENHPRISALKDLLKDLTPNHKVIVWAVFRENYGAIRKVCEQEGIKYVEVHGGVSDKEKDKSVDEFNNNDEVRVFIGNPTSGGIGINLVASDVAIFYSRNFSLEADLQAEARNHRGGSEIHKKVTRIDIVAKGTLDEEIMEALARKEKISEDVLKRMVKK